MPAKFDLSTLPASPNLAFEAPLWGQGLTRLGGVDEAGRGAWAGPVTAACVILPAHPSVQQALSGVRDSKQMSPRARERWAQVIRQVCLECGVGFASAEEIDQIGILPATRLAAGRALAELASPPQHLLTDYLILPEVELSQTSLVKGDRRSLSIAAASVLAKTARDALMVAQAGAFPAYGFDRHKGYGTARHRLAIQEVGLCPLHRRSFRIYP